MSAGDVGQWPLCLIPLSVSLLHYQIADMLGELDEVQAAQALKQMMEQALASGAPPQEIQAMAESVSAIMASRRKPAAPVAPAELAPVPQEDAVVVKIEDFASWKRRMPLFPSMM